MTTLAPIAANAQEGMVSYKNEIAQQKIALVHMVKEKRRMNYLSYAF
ncbi:MAG: hypothetical protein E7F50_03505 [Peptostreptococcus sp.]|nr:hypothetical protein HMPREF3183_01042 [Peptostreptococcus anaerobius]MDU3454944.1 hypothetical protein [Peptostreptococcus sp.]